MAPKKAKPSGPRLPTLTDILGPPHPPEDQPPAPPDPPKDGGDPQAPKPPLYWLFVGCGWLTALVWLQITHDFFHNVESSSTPYPLTTIYLMALIGYAGGKGMMRSLPPDQDPRVIKGEFFLGLWLATAAIYAWIYQNHWFGVHVYPRDLLVILGSTFTIFLGGKAAKNYLPKKYGEEFPAGASKREAAGAEENAGLDALILAKLEPYPDGLTAHEIIEKVSAPEKKLRGRLSELVQQGLLVKVSKGPTDPKTRYKLAKYT